jgi:hypothetical protein
MDNQFKWDMLLITTFFNHPDYKMGYLRHKFEERNGIDFNRLLRAPVDNRQWFCSVAVFISNYLPKLGKKLYESDVLDSFDIAEKLKDSKMDTLSIRNYGILNRRDRKEINASKKMYKEFYSEVHKICEERTKDSARSWSTVKKVGR